MKKDFQLLSPNTRVRQTVSDHLELLSKRIDQGLLSPGHLCHMEDLAILI